MLPCLVKIGFQAGSIVKGQNAVVTIERYDNEVSWWYQEEGVGTLVFDGEVRHQCFNGLPLHNPYLKRTGQIVSLKSGNRNINIIPGLAIEFAEEPHEDDYFVLGIGWDFVDACGSDDDILVGYEYDELPSGHEAYGRGPCFVPFAYLGYGRSASLAWDIFKYFANHYRRYWVFNVSGELRTSCKLSILPFVNLNQAELLTPFRQFFMGGEIDTASELTERRNPYKITFTVAQESPKLVDISINASITMTMEKVNYKTMVETGTTYTNGEDVPADDQTMVKWEGLGIYFVLNSDIETGDFAYVYCKEGRDYFEDNGTNLSWTVGHWDTQTLQSEPHYVYETGSGAFSLQNGKLQAQGYEQDINCTAMGETKHYNHQDYVRIYYSDSPTWTSDGPTARRNTPWMAAFVVTTDKPNVFAVVPVMWENNPNDEFYWKAPGEWNCVAGNFDNPDRDDDGVG